MGKTKISAWVGPWICKGGCSHAVIFFSDGSVSETFSTKARGLFILKSARKMGAVSKEEYRFLKRRIKDSGLIFWNKRLDDEDERHSQLSMDGTGSLPKGGLTEGEIQ